MKRKFHSHKAIIFLFGSILSVTIWFSITMLFAQYSEQKRSEGIDGSRRARYAVLEDDLYKSPIQLELSQDGKVLYVVCENTNEVLVVDTNSRKIIDKILVGSFPFDATLSPNERRLYVSNRWDDSVSVVDMDSMKVTHTFSVGDDPHGLITDASGKYLYVTNLATDDISVIETENFTEVKRLLTGKYPFDITRSPDGRYMYVSNQQSNAVPFREPSILELTVIDTKRQLVVGRRELFSTVIGQGVAVSPDNRFVVVALELPKNLIPETQIYQGWMVTYGFAIVEQGSKGRVAYILLDEPNLYYADPYGIAFSPDGRYLYISSSGVDMVSVVDMEKVYELLKVQDGKIGISEETIKLYARHLALSAEYVVARIPTESNPKAVVVSPDGQWVYVANRLSDSITVIDTKQQAAVETIDLGGPKVITMLRKGARLFNYSSISFQKQLSCNTCHPENHLDGLIYDIAIDGGMGKNLVDNRTMRGIAETAPFKWTGKNPTLYRQEGPRAAQLFFRSHGFEPDENEAIVRFIESIPFQPSRYLSPDGKLNKFQQRGKELFERAYTNDGCYIPMSNRCITCHPPPFYTDRMLHDVGTQAEFDTGGNFDTPQLNNIYDNVPFLHDARCYSLEEIWTVYNPDDLHGATNDMKKEQLNDLIEYMKALPAEIPPEDTLVPIAYQPDEPKVSRNLEIDDLDSFSPLTKGGRGVVTIPKAKYVGNQVCQSCHPEAYRIWVASKHARSYVMLGTMMAMNMGEEGEIQASSPRKSAKCLTCHATAATIPKEYRVPGFHIEEGVKCEACHGPGEKYIAEEIMRDRELAMAAGLLMPNEKDCLKCHEPKISHEMLNKKLFDYAASWKKIAHPEKK
ncbi:beta-propeller fold lactonase family protein [bacterium]|nr:beta-propeller fold lactonase family protein [bacterium]